MTLSYQTKRILVIARRSVRDDKATWIGLPITAFFTYQLFWIPQWMQALGF